jgi:hypothetical protein
MIKVLQSGGAEHGSDEPGEELSGTAVKPRRIAKKAKGISARSKKGKGKANALVPTLTSSDVRLVGALDDKNIHENPVSGALSKGCLPSGDLPTSTYPLSDAQFSPLTEQLSLPRQAPKARPTKTSAPALMRQPAQHTSDSQGIPLAPPFQPSVVGQSRLGANLERKRGQDSRENSPLFQLKLPPPMTAIAMSVPSSQAPVSTLSPYSPDGFADYQLSAFQSTEMAESSPTLPCSDTPPWCNDSLEGVPLTEETALGGFQDDSCHYSPFIQGNPSTVTSPEPLRKWQYSHRLLGLAKDLTKSDYR